MIPPRFKYILPPVILQNIEEILVLAILLDYEITFSDWTIHKKDNNKFEKISFFNKQKRSLISIVIKHIDNILEDIHISSPSYGLNVMNVSNLRKLQIIKEDL